MVVSCGPTQPGESGPAAPDSSSKGPSESESETFSPRYAEVLTVWPSGRFFKPDPESPVPEGSDGFALAPLFVLQPPTTGGRFKPTFGEPGLDGLVRAVSPRVFVSTGAVLLGQAEHRQFLYEWWLRADQNDQFHYQGITITVDAAGLPRLWETHADRDDLRVIYVSQAWEAKSKAAFPGRLLGRAHVVESELTTFPTTIVPRILTDGPVPMGPWVYQESNGHVMTLVCRCMSSQVTALDDGEHFRLLPRDPRWPPFRGTHGDAPLAPLEDVLRLAR
jgi:hypothetical protein